MYWRPEVYNAILHNAALRVEWREALELDPTRAHNQLCLINDFRGVSGAPDLGNVAWLEMEDRWTAETHHCA